MPSRLPVLLPAALLFLTAALWLWPRFARTVERPAAPAEATEPGPDLRPSQWAADQRLSPVWKADPAALREALAEAQGLRAEARGGPFGAWQEAGPTNVGGRISDIEFAPSAPDVVYASPATGGVFRSDDAGFTWTPIFDDQAVLTVGDLAVHPADPNTVWVGTGEANGSHNNFAGGGVYRTTDGGQTWDFLGLGETYSVGRIRIDPTDPDRVFVAALGAYFGKNEQRGVFRTTDGGATWERVLFLSDSTAVVDLAMRPDDPDVLFAASWSRIRRPTGSDLSGPTSGLWRSTDGGDTWEELGPEHGLPDPDTRPVGRIGLAICRDFPDTVYAYYTDGNFYVGIFRSDDGGETWADFDPARQADNGTSFLWWMGQIRVRPDDPDEVFVLDQPLHRHRASGTWSTDFGSGDVLHVDHHAMAFKPDEPEVILSGNDGGIDRSTDGGDTWAAINGLPITQFYEIGLDAQNPERLYGGTQDNSTNRTLTGALDDWDVIYFGDGFYTIVDPTDADVIYAEYQFGGLGKSTDGGFNFDDATSGIDFDEPRNWSTPVVMDPSDHRTLYYGTNHVYRTTNGAASWTKVSPRLAGTQPRINTVSTIGVSPADADVVWAGTADGRVWVTSGDVEAWTEVTRPNLPERWITRVIPDPDRPETAYLTFSGLKWDEPIPHVFRTDDAGQTWTDLSAGLPDAPVNALAVDPVDTDVVYVGSDVGAFVSLDRGATWGALGTGLPAVSVYDLKVHGERYLAAGTHGRSMWRLDVSNVTVAAEDAAASPGFALDAAYPNPFAGSTALSYRLGTPARVTVEVFDVRGRRVATLVDAEQPTGEHRVTWDGAGAAAGTYLVRLSAEGREQTRSVTLAR